MNNIYYLMSIVDMPGAVRNISRELSHLILTLTFSGRNYCFVDSIDEEPKALRG